MLQAALRSGTAIATRCSSSSRGAFRGRRIFGVVAVSVAPSTRSGVPFRRPDPHRAGGRRRRRRGVAVDVPLRRRRVGLRQERRLPALLTRCSWSRATFAEAVLLETPALDLQPADSAIASAASQMTLVCRRPSRASRWAPAHPRGRRSRPRAGSVRRRVRHELNLAARQRYGVRRPAQRALLHAAAHDSEADAFRAQVTVSGPARRCWSTPTTWPRRGADRIEVAGTSLGAVRLDSGDLAVQAVEARAAGLGGGPRPGSSSHQRPRRVRVRRWPRPVTGYGVGTQLVTGSGHHLRVRHKLVAREGAAGEM